MRNFASHEQTKHYGFTEEELDFIINYDIKYRRSDELALMPVALGMLVGGEPLVTQDRSLYRKHPSAVAEIAGGWFVKTYSGTAAKMGYVKRVAKALSLKLVVRKIRGGGR